MLVETPQGLACLIITVEAPFPEENNISKDVKISGFIVPLSSKVNFEQVLLDKEIFTDEKIKRYEKKFQKEVINKSLVNIFDYSKINNFFKNFIN